MTSDAAQKPQRCPASKKSGMPCTANAGSDGFCIGHSPGATEARRRGGSATSRAARAGKLLPARLRPIADLLENALQEVHDGVIEPKQAQAMASVASALVRVITSGELEERLRTLEEGAKDARSQS